MTYASEARASLITVNAVGNTFGVDFDGNVGGTPIPGLTAHADFLVTSFTSNAIEFNITLKNTSTVISRVSGLGFDTTPNLTSASSSGIFNIAVLGGAYPNGFGSIEACFKDGGGPSNCQGGGSGGLLNNQTGLFHVILGFNGPVSSFAFDRFGVRYQSIEGVTQGSSGTGEGHVTEPPPPVPEPTSLILLGTGLLGSVAARRRFARK